MTILASSIFMGFALGSLPTASHSPPTAQELGYPKGCVALYGGTGGVHLIRVDCPGPDLSGLAKETAIKAACAGGPTRLKPGRSGLKPDDYACLPLLSSGTLDSLGLVAVDVTDRDQVLERTVAFERDVRANGNTIHLRECRLIIMLTAGRADSNKSYGAVCEALLSNAAPQSVMICNDEIVGHFALATQIPANRETVIEFVKQHCIGG